MYLAGIATPLTGYSLPVGVIVAVGAAVALKLNRLSWQQFFIITSCLGAYATGHFLIYQQKQSHATCCAALQKEPFDARARIIALDTIDHPLYRNCITVKISKVSLTEKNCWTPLDCTLQLYTSLKRDQLELRVDDTIELEGLIVRPSSKKDFDSYLIKEGIVASVFIPSCVYSKKTSPSWSISRWIATQKYELLARMKQSMSPTLFSLFASIFLGYKHLPKKNTTTTRDHFTTWGVTHYLARSGLHMVIFVGIWQLLLSIIPLPWLFKELALLLFGITYCFLSWSSISFIRAFCTFVLYKGCMLLHKPIQLLQLLTLVCLAVLLTNPIQLFFLDFQLSFGLTFALACFHQMQIHHKHSRYNHKTIASP
jgi:competence protein ComEC